MRRRVGAPGPARALAVDDGEVVGYVAVVPLHGWSSHVGEVRVIVDPEHRGRGIGRALARRAVLEALELGLTKMVVEVIADQEPTIAMFRSLGFDPEALLTDHVRDRAGELRDLMILAHSVEEQWSSMVVAGIADELCDAAPASTSSSRRSVNALRGRDPPARATCSARSPMPAVRARRARSSTRPRT